MLKEYFILSNNLILLNFRKKLFANLTNLTNQITGEIHTYALLTLTAKLTAKLFANICKISVSILKLKFYNHS